MGNLLPLTTGGVDPVFMILFGVCLVILVGITVTMVWFVTRYHRCRAPEPTSRVEGSLWLEIIWTALPTLLVLAMFYYGCLGCHLLDGIRGVRPGFKWIFDNKVRITRTGKPVTAEAPHLRGSILGPLAPVRRIGEIK